ncbi:MAG: OmpA family protein [Actinobacteria bacterium]|nr:OmpA family protein [Actinomycetota bacterium]
MRGKKRRQLEELGASWMASYGDMITLLLCFFIMLFAMSTLDAQKWKALTESIKESFGAEGVSLPEEMEIPAEVIVQEVVEVVEEQMSGEEALEQLQELEERIDRFIADMGLESAIQTEIEEVGLVIRMSTDEILFELGSAELKPMAISFLDAVAVILRETANQVWVEGHTDNIPIRPGFKYPSNWELSTARASSVVRHLIDNGGLPPERMRAAGYADTKPRFPNDSEEHRYLNRRVEIVIKPLGDMRMEYREWKASVQEGEGVRREPGERQETPSGEEEEGEEEQPPEQSGRFLE